MRNIILIMAMVCFQSNLSSQNCPWVKQFEPKQTFKMVNYDAKDRITNTTNYLVEEIEDGEITFSTTMFDKNNKEVTKFDFTVACQGKDMVMDMSSKLSGLSQSLKGFELDIDAETANILYPGYIEVGKRLEDGKFVARSKVEGLNIGLMDIAIDITDRKVLAKEAVTIGGKEYECYKISSTNSMKMGFAKMTGKYIEWFSPDVGLVVRSEFYNKKNKLASYTEIEAL